MDRDVSELEFYSDNGRYADLINGIIFEGKQVVASGDLQELDARTGIWRLPYTRTGRRRGVQLRDLVRKTAFGVNYAIIGIEDQETIDYSIPLRIMSYDVGEYEKQAAGIRKTVRRQAKGLTAGEYLYGFSKGSRLCPVVTIVLYYGKEELDSATDLHGILDFSNIPEKLRKLVQNYRVNIVDVRRFEDTGVFRTDIKQVFDFLRCMDDKSALLELTDRDAAFQSVEEDTYELLTQYAKAGDLIEMKKYHRKGEKVNMGNAIRELIEDGEARGEERGIALGEARGIVLGEASKRDIIIGNMLRRGFSDEDIMSLAECSAEDIEAVRKGPRRRRRRRRR